MRREGIDLPMPVSGCVPHPAQCLAALKSSSHCVVYHDGPLQGDLAWRFQLFGHCGTGELYVEITDGAAVHVRAFQSEVQDISPTERKAGIAWPDLSEAFALARELHRSAACTHRRLPPC